ncbi:MAG: hypothetical protein L0226_01160 [Acidobacteria bacterium]|nr:hypothetical protein [Acidobacteriota bacterium]
MKTRRVKIGRLLSLGVIAFSLGFAVVAPRRANIVANAVSASDEHTAQIEAALFTRAEFFGAQAILPYPTTEARSRLAEVQRRYPQDHGILFKLAELDEKLGNVEQAHQEMLRYVELDRNSVKALEKLASFYHRRGQFDSEAATRERMITIAPRNERAAILRDLIELARRHRLEKYQKPEFFRRLISSDPSAFEVIKQFIEQLIEQKNYTESLRALRQHKAAFPEQKRFFLEVEAGVLLELKRDGEAEALYVKSFDPFWSEEQSEHFYYGFLSSRDRLRAYVRELKQASSRNPANFDVAVRLFHYLQYDSGMNDASAIGVFTQLEKARAARGVKWKVNELATTTQLLIANGQIDLASRFLYTLHQQGGLQQGSELRAKVLYQLFKLLVEAGEHRTPLTPGDLKFYQDIANADPHPGMLGGVLSLVLADGDPQGEFKLEEEIAVSHFNRAAAHRLFTAYKREYPTSPELAQMFLDLIRLYTSMGEAKTAAELLAEFEKRHSDAPEFPDVALKLADCYIGREMHEQERAIYQRVLDYLGKRRKVGTPLVPTLIASGVEDLTASGPRTIGYPPNSQEIRIQGEVSDENGSYGYSRATRFSAMALMSNDDKDANAVTYAMVLDRYVTSLARENRTADILALYSREIKKYTDEQGLYEQLLQWLGQTNLAEDQLRVYQDAIRRFPSNIWTDRLARWYLRRERKQEFEQLSRELVARLNDEEIGNYLHKFAGAGISDKASTFDQNLYLGLHQIAHERFPHNLKFVDGLSRYYIGHGQWGEWRRLMAEYYFESKQIREQYLLHLASNNKLRESLEAARRRTTDAGPSTAIVPYRLFCADAAVWLSNYEEAVDAYRELNRLYPNTPEFAERVVAFTRSFGQKDRKFLEEAVVVQRAVADASPSVESYRTAAGEIYAELGDYKRAGEQWEQLIRLGAGDEETYLNTATVYWDYFQYADALRVIKQLRRQKNDQTLSAFQAAAILEAQHQTRQALGEYVKALDGESPDYWRVIRRLKTLYKREGIPSQLRQAFQSELARTADRESLVLGYVGLLDDTGRWAEASSILKREVARSRSQDFLDNARDQFIEHEDDYGQVSTLRRLIIAARTERFAISYHLQLAEHIANEGNRDAAATILSQLVSKFPTNYGVLSESADFLWRIDKREQAINLLAKATQRGRGRFHYIFARKLAARQNERGQLAAAERTLKSLYAENPRNLDVFNEFSRIYVRTSRPDELRDRYRETIRAIKQSDLDRLEIRDQIAELREQVIEAFTQIKDYKSAIEQHIEIINREPDAEETVDTAIRYAKRYGGADQLIDYYTMTSQQAYKDYRWNLVLARIYDAKSDWAGATRELRKAILNQPEMVELHSELADVCVKAKDYKGAVDALTHARELSNDDPQYLKRLAETLDKAGRHRDAEAVRAKLPVEKPKTLTVSEQFADAERMRRDEKARAIEIYRKAFNAFAGDFYKHELKAHELTGYIETLREEEPLDQILRRLWEVREQIKRDADSRDNFLAGKARSLLVTFDRALPEAAGKVAAEYATGAELAAIDRDARQWMNSAKSVATADDTLVILFNLGQRAGLSKLAEQVLITRMDAAYQLDSSLYRSQMMALVNFYSERGAYQRAIELLEREEARDRKRDGFNYRTPIAEYARLIGDREKELRALRAEFQSRAENRVTQTDQIIERYFEALLENGEAGRGELRQCIRRTTPYHFQLINYLVRNNELQLAREAIDASPMPASWKSARQAELSTVTRDMNQENEAHFLQALHWKTVGEMVSGKPDASQQLIGDNWFHLAENYGRWLASSEKARQKRNTSSGVFLPAMLESRPKDENMQWRLGRWYLEQNEPQKALEHLTLAAELNPLSKGIVADVGSAYFKLGKQREAREQWNRILKTSGETSGETSGAGKGERVEPKIEDCRLYLRTLAKQNLATEARTKLKPYVIKRLSEIGRESNDEMEELKPLIRALVSSFDNLQENEEERVKASSKNDAVKAGFLRSLGESTLLAEMVIRESLVGRNQLAAFYEMLVRRNSGIDRYEYDSDFVDRLRMHPTWSAEEVEESLDHEIDKQNATQVSASGSQQFGRRVEWQQEYLENLLTERRTNEALKLVSEIEKGFKGKYPRPDWLRLAQFRAEVRAGRTAQATAGLKRFIGIEVSPRIERIAPPKLERLNQAVEMLRREGRKAEADEILKAAYERMLALEQLQPASFIGLSRLAFEIGEAERGLKLLKLMSELGKAETRETAAAELASLPWVKARSVNAEWVEMPQPCNQIEEAEALRLAAETAAEFNQFAAAIEYRRQLIRLSRDDSSNRIELARLFAVSKREDEAINSIASLLSDRLVSRQVRWTALWIAPEVANGRDDLWRSLDQRLRGTGSVDQEVAGFLEALSLFHRKQVSEAIKVSSETAKNIPTPQGKLLFALLQKNAGQEREALQSLLASLIDMNDVSVTAPFSSTEDDLRWQDIRLYAKQGQLRAALKLAGADERLKGIAEQEANQWTIEDEKADFKSRFKTLSARAAERQRQSQIELLALLSNASEQINDLSKAADFERARLALLTNTTERRKSETRIEFLTNRQKEQSAKKTISFTVEQGPSER